MSAITTHVLDTARGTPAGGIAVRLEHWRNGAWQPAGQGVTDGDGRCRTLLAPGADIELGRWRLTFETGRYFSARDLTAFFPEVAITFDVVERTYHHVPLLLSPFAYSTYRGS